MGSALRSHPAWLLKIVFVLATCFAVGLVTAGVVSGAGPLATLSTTTDSEPTATDTTTTEPTDTEATEGEPTEPSATETESTESEPAAAGTPIISAEKDDYVPSEIVTLWGSGWASGESVEIFVNDDEGKSWSHTGTATADELGAFMYEFRLPDWFVATYYMIATGDSGLIATGDFADSVAVGASSTNSNGGSGMASQEITISAPAVSAGDVLMAQIVITDSITSTVICPPSGWTTVLKNNREDKILQETFWFRASADAGAISYTWQFRTNSCVGSLVLAGSKGASGGVTRYTGAIASGSPIDAVGGGNSSSSGPFTAPSVTTTVANTRIIRYFGVFKNTNITHGTATRNYHVASSTTKERAAAAFDGGAQAAIGATGTFTATLGSSAEAAFQTVALKPALAAVSDAPVVTSPICAGATSVAGTSTEANGTSIDVFKNGVSVGTTTVSSGAWTKSSLAALVAGDLIKARATASGETVSVDSNTVTVTACNTAPVANDDPYAVNEDATLNVSAPGVLGNDTDADGDSLTAAVVAGPASAASFTLNANGSFDYTPNANFNGMDSFTYKANDGTADSNVATVTITVDAVDDAPTAVDDAPTVAEDSGATSIDVLANDTDADGGTMQIASVTQPANGTVAITGGGTGLTYAPDANYCNGGSPTDDFSYTLNGGSVATVSVSVTCVEDVNNAPSVDIDTPVYGALYAVGSTVALSASFTDSDTGDTHTCGINWDNGTTTGNVTETNGSGTCTGSRTYLQAGVYSIKITVTDNGGLSGTDEVLVVVYDPNGGFVTGGGWINSPAGAYRAEPTLTGRANFGFVSKYKKGASAPEGQTEFQFQTGGLNFHSEAYQWLVVAGAKAQFKGTGKVNGVSGYGFLLTTTDGQRNGGGGVDRFRIKIWKLSDGSTVYDNNYGASDDVDNANPQAIAGGSIVIHDK